MLYDIDYKKWTNYLVEILKEHGIYSGTVLDMACGTGNISVELSKLGYNVTGVDISEDMLTCAINKMIDQDMNIDFIKHNMINFKTSTKFNAIICLLDSVNYILNINDLKVFFDNTYNMLEDSGVFIFDVNSEYKLKEIIGNNIFYDLGDEINYIWTNYFNYDSNICRFDLTFFIKNGNMYKKYDETHYEKAYKQEDLIKILSKSNYIVNNVFDDLDFVKPKAKSERIFFVCKKNI